MFNNLRIGWAIFAACIVPLCSVTYLSAAQGFRSLSDREEVVSTVASIKRSEPVLDLITAFQAERGAGVLLLSSETDESKASFAAEVERTDGAISQVLSKEAADLPSGLVEAIPDAATLERYRSSITDAIFRPEDAQISYGAHIDALFEILNADVATAGETMALNMLANAIEHAGREANEGIEMLGLQMTPVGFSAQVVTSASAQQVYLDDFARIAPPMVQPAVEAMMSGTEAGRVSEMRTEMLDAADLYSLPEFDLAAWQMATKARVDQMESLLEAARQEILSGADARAAAAQATFTMTVLQAVAVLLIATAVAGAASINLSRSIGKLTKTMRALAEGQDVEIPFSDRKNEMGEMAAALHVFKANTGKVAELTRNELELAERSRTERQSMMASLQREVGGVVDAAVSGDFSRRVAVRFEDAELEALASGVNQLVSTFDRAVVDVGQVMGALAHTDLTKRMTGEYDGALARLKSDVNAVAVKLSEVIGELRQTSGSLKAATEEILVGANDLSERTTKQAATLEETSAAMEHLASTVVRNASRASEASSNAARMTASAEQGGEVMNAATGAMERISQSSTKISNIIGMIDDIAFQTNLLALNASVEAARAGDAGKGFAVVAVEVRRLAQSAAQASNEVKTLIDQSSQEVAEGNKLVTAAAANLQSMLEAVRGNGGLLDSIARDSREQASAIEEVSSAVRSMDEMTQHNAALVEQTNAAIEKTEAQASRLDEIVDVFKLEAAQALEKIVAAPKQSQRQQGARHAFSGNTALASDWDEF